MRTVLFAFFSLSEEVDAAYAAGEQNSSPPIERTAHQHCKHNKTEQLNKTLYTVDVLLKLLFFNPLDPGKTHGRQNFDAETLISYKP